MAYETIRVETDERGVARVTLNRPEKHNAMNARMIADLDAAAQTLGTDPAVRVVVLAGEGRSFCAGADLGWMRAQADTDRAGKIAEARMLARMLGRWNALPRPVIGRVQGAAYGGGVGLMAVCDIVIAAEDVKLALTEVRLGLLPATIGPFVVRRLGEGFARQVFFSARPFGAEFGLRSGLVARSCAVAALDETVEAEVQGLLSCAPGAVAAAKALCRDLAGSDPAEMAEKSARALADRWETDEARIGIAAFFDREPPPWQRRS